MGIHLLDARLPKGERVYAIGDVHGCIKQLEKLLKLIKQDLKSSPVKQHYLVFVGDYVDRGPDSMSVIDRLIMLKNSQDNVICLKGNHEDKLLQFLDKPEKMVAGFLTYGGVETALSYGVKKGALRRSMKKARELGETLSAKIPEEHRNFFSSLEISVSIGDYFFCHAGVRPGVKLKKQAGHDLMWIRQEFLSHPGLFKRIIVHGHTPHFEPEVMPNRINIDTKCYDSEILTSLVLEERGYRFIQTVR